MRICFRLILSVELAAVALWAADLSGQPKRIVTVVRPDPRSGKLVRSVLVTSKAIGEPKAAATVAAVPEGHASLDEAVRVIAVRHALSPQFLDSVIKVESNYNPLAVSAKGALGMMQLIPSTARRFGVANVFNPVENIEGGARYLRYLLNLYSGDYPLALAAYNAGEQAVAKYGGVPPFPETQNYLVQVRKQMEAAQGAGQENPVAAKPDARVPSGPAHILEIREPDGSVRYVSR
jgi:soluble lytic murein transglycosylase-like protein